MRRTEALIWIAGATGGICLGYAIARPEVQAFIENSGVNIPTENVIRDYAAGLVWACVLLVFVLMWPVSRAHKKLLAAAWLVKSFIALVVMLPYEEHYSGLDCWPYFQRSHLGLSELSPGMLNGGSDLIVWLGALHLKVGPDSYHAMKLSFALLGLVGIYLFYRSAEILIGKYSPLAFWALTLYPSVLFWSSILGKDPAILAAIALHVWGLVNVAVRRKNWYLVAVLAGIGGASAVRIWMGPILILPCLFVLGIRIKQIAWRMAAVVLVSLALATVGPATIDRLELDKASDLLGATRTINDSWNRANSSLSDQVELNSTWDVLLFTPEGFFITYFRPLPGDVPHLFGWLAGFENLGLLLLSIWALFRLRFVYFRNPIFLWSVALLLTWGLAYTPVAYRDLGTAVRFKLQIIPVLLGLIGYMLRQPSRRWALRRSGVGTQGFATP
jgi:hypothetical protein